jgi:hypothetical protein
MMHAFRISKKPQIYLVNLLFSQSYEFKCLSSSLWLLFLDERPSIGTTKCRPHDYLLYIKSS